MAAGVPLDGIPELLARGEVSSRELTQAYLERIEALDGPLGSTFAVLAQSALAEAGRADRARAEGRLLGPLHGVPVGVKDNIDVAGTPTTVGASALLRPRTPAARDAECVARLRRAGAVVLAKLALHELAYGVTCVNRHVHDCRNAWDLGRIPGGSSAGSGAAVAADLCTVALGTDTGGSVRIPAALNGVTALRPTPGRVPLDGVFPVSWTYDTVGPLARSAADCARAAEALGALPRAGGEGPAGGPPSLRNLRVAIPPSLLLDDAVPEALACAEAVVEALCAAGAVRVQADVPGAAESHRVVRTLIQAEAYAVHRERLAREPEAFGEDVRRRLLLGAAISGADYAAARDAARRLAREALLAFAGADLLVAPTTGAPAPLVAGAETIATTDLLTRATYAWTAAGLPTASVPAGRSHEGLPLGVQLAAAPGQDATVLAAAAAWQRSTGWHLLRPPLGDSRGTAGTQ